MKSKIGIILLGLVSMFVMQNAVFAQSIQNIDVKNLSSSQLNQAKQMLSSSGLSIEQAIEEAKKNGASDAQIAQMKERMGASGNQKNTQQIADENNAEMLMEQDSLLMVDQGRFSDERFSEPLVNKDSLNFGSYLFNSNNLSFEPNVNLQTPKGYVLSIGDEVLINIWGNSVQNYQLIVDRNGQIQIPKIGPVFISGQTFEKASKKIRNRLTSIYADLGGSDPNTFAQVSLGRLRSVRVNLVGEVEIPGTYTLPATASVFNALYLSGGPGTYGSFRNIEIHRDNKLFQEIDLYDFLLKADQSNNIILQSEDLIFIPVSKKRVLVSGEFKRKAFYELQESESLEDLINFTGGFTDAGYRRNIKIYRKTQDGMNILDVQSDDFSNAQLFDGDQVIAERIVEDLENEVTISGSVFRPGKYQWSENLTLEELILRTDGIIPSAEVELGHLSRLNPDSTLTLISFNVREILAGEDNIDLQPKDSIMIKSHFELKDQPTITVDGQVREGGSFDYLDNMSVIDAIYIAGGFTEVADTNYVQISRRLSYDEASVMTDKLVDVFTIPISRTIRKPAEDLGFKLMPYDHIFIRKAPGAKNHGTVQINGEVMYAGYYAIQTKKDRISDLIEWSGGLSPEAYVDAATLTKIGAGPVGIDLQQVISNQNSRNNLKLNPGDVLTIPAKPETVNVFGEVQNPFATVYEPNKTVKYYIEKSGGWGERPHRRRIYVTYPDGSSSMTRSFIGWKYPKVKPGAEIHVPKKPERTNSGNALSTILATASTAASLGIAAATLANMLDKN